MSYKVVYIDNALSQLENPVVWNILNEPFRLRVRGYRKEYGECVHPLSKDDFFSTQILIYKDENLVCTYKFTRADLCTRYNVTFPLIAALEDGKITDYTHLIQGLLDDSARKGHSIAYCGGWTIDPEVRMDKESSQTVRELVLATHFDYLKTFNIDESIICGVIKFKAHLLQESIGYKRIQRNGEQIGSVGLAYLDFEPVYMLHLTEHNLLAEEIYQKHKAIMDRAVIYSKELQDKNKKAA